MGTSSSRDLNGTLTDRGDAAVTSVAFQVDDAGPGAIRAGSRQVGPAARGAVPAVRPSVVQAQLGLTASEFRAAVARGALRLDSYGWVLADSLRDYISGVSL